MHLVGCIFEARDQATNIQIRAMGVPAGKSSGRFDECRQVEIEYTQAAASTFTKVLAPPLEAKGKTFRFVYTSGMFVEQGETKSMWFLKEQRTIKVPHIFCSTGA